MSEHNHPSHHQGKIVSLMLRCADPLLDRTGDVGENIIRVGADEPNRAHDDHKDHGQHYGILSNVLSFLLAPQSPKMIHSFLTS
jgi:hypothetical protein